MTTRSLAARLQPLYAAGVLAAAVTPFLLWPDLLTGMLRSDGFMPHGHCYLWKPGLIWLHAAADSVIGVSYLAIAATLAFIVHRARRDLPFHWVVLAFGLFTVACAATHFMEVWTLWSPRFWLAADVKVVTALASVATAAVLPPLAPRVLALVRAAKESEECRMALEKAHAETQDLYRRVKRLDEVKTQFFANVSHELRTPLTLVLGPTGRLLASGELTGDQRRDLEVVDKNARLLLKQVNDLLEVAKLEAGKLELRYSEIDLARLVRLTATHFEGVARSRGVAFSVVTPASLRAQVDPEKVQRILLNLLSNAFKFVPDGGRIVVELCPCGEVGVNGEPAGTASLTVLDSGPGVKPEHRASIFERFHQVDDGAVGRFGGTGLGLAIARELIELHGGSIGVEEAPGGGALFRTEVPRTAPAGAELHPSPDETAVKASRAAALQLAALHEADGGCNDLAPFPHHRANGSPHDALAEDRPLVLVVEDDIDMRHFIAESLSSDYRVVTAANGRDGFRRARQLRPDLVLTDVMMPEESGEEMVRKLRSDPELDGVPIAVLTARADDELALAMLRDGVQEYLRKPFSTDELRARVANLIAMKRTRDVLQREVASQSEDLIALATEVAARKRQTEDTLARLQASEAAAAEASRAKDEFLATLSHELRTPLTSMLGWAQLLRTGQLDAATAARGLETIYRNTQLQTELIDDLLDLSRIVSGKFRLETQPVELGPVVQAAVDSAFPGAVGKGVHLDCPDLSRAGVVLGDPDRLQQVVWNLLSNAVKFTPAGGRVDVAVKASAGRVWICVSDTGQGIAADVLPHVFERFHQGDSSTTRTHSGLGLGLAIVRHLVELHGGTVGAESPGLQQGATFTVELPLAGSAELESATWKAEDGAATSPSRLRPEGDSAPPRPLEGVRVLLVDDEPDALQVLGTMLRMHGAEVSLAASAAEALRQCERSRPDVLVSDLSMPEKSGYDLIRELRERPPEHGGSVPAAAVTAHARDEDRDRALGAGFQVHLAKPIEPTRLVTIVADLADRLRGR